MGYSEIVRQNTFSNLTVSRSNSLRQSAAKKCPLTEEAAPTLVPPTLLSRAPTLSSIAEKQPTTKATTQDDWLTSSCGNAALIVLLGLYVRCDGVQELIYPAFNAMRHALPYAFFWACWKTTNVQRLGLLMGTFSILVTLATSVAKRMGKGEWSVYDPSTGKVQQAYKTIDRVSSRAWAFHGCAALVWLLCATTSMALTKRASKQAHRKAGMAAMFALCVHTSGALNILYTDYENHSLLNKFLLGGSIFGVWADVIQGMRCLRRGDRAGHKQFMFAAFVKSMDGAGTIRAVALIQNHLGYNVVHCQVAHGPVGGVCDWMYTFRMLYIVLVRQFKLLCAARAMGNKQMIRCQAVSLFSLTVTVILGHYAHEAGVPDSLIVGVVFAVFMSSDRLVPHIYGTTISPDGFEIPNKAAANSSFYAPLLAQIEVALKVLTLLFM